MAVYKKGTILRWKNEPSEIYIVTDTGYKYIEGKHKSLLGSTFSIGSFWYDVNRWEPITDEFTKWVYEVRSGQITG